MNTVNCYMPDNKYLNEILYKWKNDNIKFVGIIHSHIGRETLSLADLFYAENVMISNSMDELFMALFILERNKLVCYKLAKNK